MTIVVDESGKKKKKLKPSALQHVAAPDSLHIKSPDDHPELDASPDVMIVIDESGNKKKKLKSSALQLVTAPVIDSSSLNMGISPVNHVDRPENAKEDTANEANVGADQMVMSDHNPEPQVPSTANPPGAIPALVRRIRSARTSLQMYSGIKGIRYDEIFYGKTKRGQEVQIDDQYEELEHKDGKEIGSSWVVAANNIGNG